MARIRDLETVPLMPLRSTVVYPSAAMSVQIGMEATLAVLAAYPADGLEVVTVVDPGPPDEPSDPRALEKIGVLSRLTDRLYMPGGAVQATVQGQKRVRIRAVERSGKHFVARIEEVEEREPDPEDTEETITRILSVLEALAADVARISPEVPAVLRMNVGKPGRFADLVATLANFTVASKDEVLQRLDIGARLRCVRKELESELVHLREVETADRTEGRREGPEQPRDHADALRRQIKRLQVELGQVDPAEHQAVQLLRRIERADLPAHVASRARQEVERLRAVGAAGLEGEEIRMYIDWLLHMPWTSTATDGPETIDLDRIRGALDDQLLGLDEPKSRLLDDLAVARLRGDLQGPVPCIVGPPDVGKSALIAAVAHGLGRPLARIEIAGRGEADLIGARRTQRDARPGKIAGAFRDVAVCDPVFVLGDADLVGAGKVQGDPVEALESVLAWDSRRVFVDRYLDVEFDLSRAIILAVAQDFQRIPRKLREMMAEIRIAGYTPEEKVAIARGRVLPRLIGEHGLEPEDVGFDDEVFFHLVRSYTRDSGMERTHRLLSTLLRTRARAKAQGDEGRWDFDADRIQEIIGPPRFVATVAESAPEIGVVTGLAWTSAGGELLFIEALKMAGTGRLIITGSLGDVMKESVNAAHSYVRSRADELKIPSGDFAELDLHVHFPVGAVPKDGPSAGVAVTLALASTLAGLPVRHDIAMTGEMTLRGKVLEVGGIKEKVLAAYRAGIRSVILPTGNERDLRDVPSDAREKTEFHFVERMDEVLELALLSGPRAREEPDDVEPVNAESEDSAELERAAHRRAGDGAERRSAGPPT